MLASTSRAGLRRCGLCGAELALSRRSLAATARRGRVDGRPGEFETPLNAGAKPAASTSSGTARPPSAAADLPSFQRQPHAVRDRLRARVRDWVLTQNGARNPDGEQSTSWLAVAIFVATGAGLWYYFDSEKKRVKASLERQRATRSVGRADIGGPFVMQTADGVPFTERDLLGRFHLVYFGFTNCPDVCPEELDKIGKVVDEIRVKHGQDAVRPVFVSVDPGRDTPAAMKKYLVDFHPDIIGLVGEYDAVKAMCKKYRVYFSTTPDTKPGDDYLVDHSIFFYLMSPEGHFVDAFGKVFTKDEVVDKVDFFIKEYKDGTRWGVFQDL